MDYMSREQLRTLFSLGSVRNANYVLRKLSPYLSSFRDGYQSIYYLSKQGREYVGATKICKKTLTAQHTITRNQFYLHAGRPANWWNEQKVSDGKVTLVPDALFAKDGRYYFLEVDLTQTMAENRKKLKAYAELRDRGLLTKNLGTFPGLIWVTTSEHRRKQLVEASQTFNAEVYTDGDIR